MPSETEAYESSIRSGARSTNMPTYQVAQFNSQINAAATGPGTGITALESSKVWKEETGIALICSLCHFSPLVFLFSVYLCVYACV